MEIRIEKKNLFTGIITLGLIVVALVGLTFYVSRSFSETNSGTVMEGTEYETVNVAFQSNGGSYFGYGYELQVGKKYDSYETEWQTDEYSKPLPIPYKEGYAFGGWCLDAECNNPITSETVVENTENHLLYAKWVEKTTENQVTVTLNTIYEYDEPVPMEREVEVTVGGVYGFLPVPKVERYKLANNTIMVFNGWCLDAACTQRVYEGTKVTKTTDHTLYANWGSYVELNHAGDYYQVPYGFSENRITTSSVISEPIYEPAGVQISDRHQGTDNVGDPYSSNVLASAFADKPATGGYQNRYFQGYYLDNGSFQYRVMPNTIITRDYFHVLYAKWGSEAPSYDPYASYVTVVFIDDEEQAVDENDDPIPNQTIKVGPYYCLDDGIDCSNFPTLTKEGYNFTGWYLDRYTIYGIRNRLVAKTTDHYLYAGWHHKAVRLTFNAKGGAVSPAYKDTYYDEYYRNLPTPTKAGATFEGWYLDEDCTASKKVTSNVQIKNEESHTLYAKWIDEDTDTYTIKYYENDGQDVENLPYASDIKVKNVNYTIINRGPNKYAGHTFKNWNTKRDGSGTTYQPGATYSGNADLVLYAQYTSNKYILTLDANGGTVTPTEIQVTYGVPVTELPEPTWKNHTFLGWYKDTLYQIPVSPGDEILYEGNNTLYARWQENIINIEEASDYELIKGYIVIPKNTTANKLAVKTGYNINYKRETGKPSTNEYVGTGDTVTITKTSDTTKIQSFIVVVIGDVDGNGKLSMMDYMMIKNNILKKLQLSGAYIESANVNRDNKISMMDYMTLKYHLIELHNE